MMNICSWIDQLAAAKSTRGKVADSLASNSDVITPSNSGARGQSDQVS